MMTAPAPTRFDTHTDAAADDRVALGPLWRRGLAAGVVASAATTAMAAASRVTDLGGLETVQDEPIPLAGFPHMTFISVLVGLVLASVLARRARHPQRAFTRATVALTALSCVPSVLIVAGAASIAVSIATHVVAAAIVVPAVRTRLPR